MKVEWSHRPGTERESSPERCSLIFNLRSVFFKMSSARWEAACSNKYTNVYESVRTERWTRVHTHAVGMVSTESREEVSRWLLPFFSGCLCVPLRSLTNNLSLFSKQTRGLTAGHRQVSAEEPVVERGASIRLRKILSFMFPLSLCHQYLSRNSLFSFFSPVSSFWNLANAKNREKKTNHIIFLSSTCTGGMARIGRATISRVGALRDSSTRASHHAVPPTAELQTSAVARRQQVKIK